MNKKAQGLTINTIILLILGIVVFAILTYMFYSTSKDYNSGTNNAAGDVKSRLCSTIGTCAKTPPGSAYYGSSEPEPDGGWIDCNTADGNGCYKRIASGN